MDHTVYGLFDLDAPDVVRYVGLTRTPLHTRIKNHRSRSTFGSATPVHTWIREIGVDRVGIKLLEKCAADQAKAREVHWIEELKTLLKDGGLNALRGRQLSPELREAVRQQFSGKPKSDQHRARTAATARSAANLARSRETGRAAGVKSGHVRGHARKGIVNPECPYC